MKLHLPKLLCVAVMAAMACTTVQAVEAVVNVGLVDTSVDGSKHAIITADTTDVTVGKNQAAGAFTTNADGNEVLITSFGDYSGTANNKVISNHLEVTGKLTISDNGQVYLGGQVKKTTFLKKDAYGGLIADSVEINGDGSVTNLNVGAATIGTLTLNSGKAELHTTGTSGGNSVFSYGLPTVGDDCKNVTIKKALNVNGGSLKMGYQSRAQSGSSHYQTYFANNAKINQTGGSITIAAQARLASGVSITQSGGTFDTPTTVNGQLAFELGSGSYTINQINPESGEAPEKQPELTIRRLAAASTTKLDITQTADKGLINLTAGTNVAGTVFKLKNTSTLKQDTVTGVINLNGDFSGATYNVEQSGSGTININSDCKFVANELSVGGDAKLNVKGTMTVNGTSTLSGTVNVAENASFTLNGETTVKGNSSLLGNVTMNGDVIFEDTANVSVSSTLSMSTGHNMTFNIGSVEQDHASMTMTETGNLAILGGTVTLELSDVAIQEMAAGATYDGTEYHVTLIDNLSAADVGELESILNTDLSLESYELTVPVTLAAAIKDPVTITSDTLVIEDNALKAVVLSTKSIPEPTTATLSLLALAGLAARRRRQK